MAVTRKVPDNNLSSAWLEIITEGSAVDIPSIGAAASVAVNVTLSTTGILAVGDFLIPLTTEVAVADGELIVSVANPVATVDVAPLIVHNASAGAVDPASVTGFKFLVIHASALNTR